MVQQPPIKIKRPQVVLLHLRSGPWLPAAMMDLKQDLFNVECHTHCHCLTQFGYTHLHKKNRTSVQFHRSRETSLFPTNTEQHLGSFLRIKEMCTLDLNHTVCNQKHHIFCSSSFLEFLKAVYFSKPNILSALQLYQIYRVPISLYNLLSRISLNVFPR